MSFYESLAPLYDALFPFAPASLGFLESLVGESPSEGRLRRALDAGCATGALVLALAERGWEAIGIEPEAAMVEAARDEARRRGLGLARFVAGDMLDAPALVGPGPFDLVLCLGNTLPHLPPVAARRFLAIARGLLGPGGCLALQLVNYAAAEIRPGFRFPDLVARGYRFRRRYEPAAAEREGMERLRFVGELVDERDGSLRTEELLLHALTPAWLQKNLEEAGFAPPRLASGWDGGSFAEERDRYLIAAASPR